MLHSGGDDLDHVRLKLRRLLDEDMEEAIVNVLREISITGHRMWGIKWSCYVRIWPDEHRTFFWAGPMTCSKNAFSRVYTTEEDKGQIEENSVGEVWERHQSSLV